MNKIKVYVTCDWSSDAELFNAIRAYGFGSTEWKDIEFTLEEDYDRVIILRGPNPASKDYDARRAITFLTEPTDSEQTLRHASASILSYIPLPWWHNVKESRKRHIRQLGGIRKTKMLSSVTSDKFYMEGHQKRIEMLLYMDRVFEEGLDIYGRDESKKFSGLISSHRGALADKYDGLWTYKYHFASENSFIPDYYTEKILDPIIAECLCFYDGCKNLEEFIDERAFIRIDVGSPRQSIEKMIKAMEENEWRRRIKYIRQQKKRLLSDLNPLNIFWLAVNEADVLKRCKLYNW